MSLPLEPTAIQPSPPPCSRTVLIIGVGEILETHLEQALAAHAPYRPMLLSAPDARTLIARLQQGNASNPHLHVLDSVDCVVNCMAGAPEGIGAVTRALLDAARRHPPRRIVHISSMSVYGAACGIVDEATEPVAPLNAYMRTRIECEAMMRQYAADGGDAVILRPSCIIGPDSEAWSNRVARLLTAGRLGDLGAAGDGICNLIPVDDLALVVIAMLSAEGVSGETFNVSAAGSPMTWNGFLLRYARAIGATPTRRISARQLRVEARVIAPLLRALGLVAGRLGIRTARWDALTPSFLRSLQQDITICTEKLARQLQQAPPPLGNQIEDAARAWLASQPRARSRAVATGRDPSKAGIPQ